MKSFISRIFGNFNWQKLNSEEQDILKSGIEKHYVVLKFALFFLVFQIALAIIAPKILTLLTVCSFIALMLGGAWYQISFQNVSADQLDAGVADYITLRMFRAFVLAFNVLPVGTIVFMAKVLLPELNFSVSIGEFPVWSRVLLLTGNVSWVLIVWKDVFQASVCYDAADSLLGDGFPTLMRGANANARNLPMLDSLKRIEGILVSLTEPKEKEAAVPVEEIEINSGGARGGGKVSNAKVVLRRQVNNPVIRNGAFVAHHNVFNAMQEHLAVAKNGAEGKDNGPETDTCLIKEAYAKHLCELSLKHLKGKRVQVLGCYHGRTINPELEAGIVVDDVELAHWSNFKNADPTGTLFYLISGKNRLWINYKTSIIFH